MNKIKTKNSVHKMEYCDTYISSYVDWVRDIFNSDVLLNVNFLNIENEKKEKKKRKLNQVEKIIKKSKIINEENSPNNVLIEETNNKDENNCYLKNTNFNESYKSTNFNIIESNNNKHNLNENYFINNNFNMINSSKKNSSSCDISEIDSEEDSYKETIEKNNNVDHSNIFNDNFKNLSEICNNLNKITPNKLNRDIILNENSNKIYNHRLNIIGDEVSNFLIYTSDKDDINNDNEEEIKSNNSIFISFNYDQFKKNVHLIEEIDKEFYSISKEEEKKQERKKEKSGKIVNNNSNNVSNNISFNNYIDDNINYNINANNNNNNNNNYNNDDDDDVDDNNNNNDDVDDNNNNNDYDDVDDNNNENKNEYNNNNNNNDDVDDNNNNNNDDDDDNNNPINFKKNEKIIKEENFSSNNNFLNNFCFWNIESDSYISRPLYVQNNNKKYFTFLEESEEMIKNYSSNQYSIKFVPRHLLYVLSQVASRIFFDPMYRKQLFFQF
ncbi:conserved Plasmodium protein, unknown function [Plasmodium gallinaceum]|uniref:Uncharacterized protein n=1 Tax=Plasmodium gallinaceum TaxID=5849 RepID=A0A1J1GSI1_PLAGA|nr:conserved Plasmodium protein, unknown function [Plasmodium gallinaceum]CRG95441.1 conserved Plasmodium protein, unknown function [Plasmodium gallinaceum]